MSLVKTYAFGVDFYSGFKASEHTYEKFDNPIDAIKAYKKSLSHDFDYDDAFHHTNKIFSYFRHVVDKTDKIGHAYAVTPKRRSKMKFGFSEDEIAHLLSIDDDVEDEIII